MMEYPSFRGLNIIRNEFMPKNRGVLMDGQGRIMGIIAFDSGEMYILKKPIEMEFKMDIEPVDDGLKFYYKWYWR